LWKTWVTRARAIIPVTSTATSVETLGAGVLPCEVWKSSVVHARRLRRGGEREDRETHRHAHADAAQQRLRDQLHEVRDCALETCPALGQAVHRLPRVCPRSGNAIWCACAGACGVQKGRGGEEMWREDGGAA